VSGPDRFFLPGWWKFWEPSPQWSSTASQRLGVPAPSPPGDFHLWEGELRQVLGHSGTGGDTLTGAGLTATFDTTVPGPGRAGRPGPADELTDELAERRRARDAKEEGGQGQ
jgi:hypothetical protein